jgi:NAD(P)-dependent dehydrogenase (short-subunit alcohol dehydrogenase family)
MIAKALEANGAKVYIIGRRLGSLEKVAKEAKHGKIIPLRGDVTSKSDLARVVDTITQSDGFINVLIANAGIAGPESVPKKDNPTLAEIRDHLWEPDTVAFNDTFNANTTAVYYSTVAFLKLLDAGNQKGNVEQKSQVIAISSVASLHRNVSGYAYSTSKAAVNHMMKMMATSWVPFHIRANVIAPGSKSTSSHLLEEPFS